MSNRYSIVPFSLHQEDQMVEMRQRGLVVINDHQILSDLLGGVLKDHRFELIGSFTHTEIGLAYILTSLPDLVSLDMMLPIMRTRSNGKADVHHPYILIDPQTLFTAVKGIRAGCPRTKVLILTGERHPPAFPLGFEAGTIRTRNRYETLGLVTNIGLVGWRTDAPLRKKLRAIYG